VTLAIGIVAFAFIGIFGLIPTGLNVFHQAVNASVGSQIAQKVINDIKQTDFTTLVSSGGNQPFIYTWPVSNGSPSPVRYFDEQGNELAGTHTNSAIYQVRTRVTPATVMPYTAAGTQAAATDSNLATITVQIAAIPANLAIPVDSSTQLWSDSRFRITTLSALVSKNQ
jgi:uncharacterized protein (TIGR02598 family)